MMIGENNKRPHPTIHIPQWDSINDPTCTISSPFSNGVNDHPHSPSPFLDSFTSLYRYLPSNELTNDSDESSLTDEFRMYEFKIRRCARGRSHDWTECPFAHPGEKARRRDPRKFHYSGTACPEFRKGSCRRGDSCEFAHGVFECWLHPSRYRTQPCKDGTSCRRRICFFAHTTEQLRVLPCSLDPDLGFFSSKSGSATSPTSILVSPQSESPPLSPSTGEIIASMRKMQLNGGCSWGSPMRSGVRLPFSSSLRPMQAPTWPRIREFEIWESEREEEAPAMEFVESGKELRAKMYAKLSRENSLG
ncbi:PREDICTED: zinc finger CCCH domain-containing protein 23-like [Camelina sativa]|uniref:Zinc finger CCCH domain-containing protein 23-like n=1 Tax=Camelina sativa TaxID=90675 RepID=A0ABM0SX22_CAMSA|nr:PREDICTED: zinc finger CCCH domain-containing protein 23-like [Camelina sativa]